MNVKHVTTTPNAEETMVYIARVSSPKDEVEKRKEPAKLLRYCMNEGHWGVFMHGHMTLEIDAPRWLTRQFLRHWSMAFSEFSQRYSAVPDEFFISECRMQDTKNRQSSLTCTDEELSAWWQGAQVGVWEKAHGVYTEALDKGIAKEVARNVLPEGAYSTLFITASARSWIHMMQARTHRGAQKEIQQVANWCLSYFQRDFPTCAKALELKDA